MSSLHNIELGQLAFSNTPIGEYDAHWASHGLELIAEAITVARGDDPDKTGLLTSNHGCEPFENDVFAMRTYCWCSGDAPGHDNGCPPNFVYNPTGLTITWYKHAARGVTANQPEPDPFTWVNILNTAIKSITTATGEDNT